MSRAELFTRLQSTEFDLLVVGGGITGAGIARDAALRGLQVALIERGDLARGTSSASSKLIHGGLRYLEQYEFLLVRESVRERALLSKNAPHLARPLPFLFPVYKGGGVKPWEIRAGMWLYDVLALFSNFRSHKILSRAQTRRVAPLLEQEGLQNCALYYDCLTDDARLTAETALDAATHGAAIATYCEAIEFTVDSAGRTTGVWVRDRLDEATLTGEGRATPRFPIKAKVTCVAAGPWTDEVLAGKVQRPLLRPTKGSHVVLDRERLPVDQAVVIKSSVDGRVLFAIPWAQRTILGTTDTDAHESPDVVEASREDVDYLLASANSYFPSLHATPADVISTWSGLRPLMAAGEGLDPSEVSREHAIVNVDPGLLAIAGGKLTTYRLMAEQAVDKALRKLGFNRKLDPCRTTEVPLPGGAGFAVRDLPSLAKALAKSHALEPDVALHLVHSYGRRAPEVIACGQHYNVRPGRIAPDLPFTYDEVAYAAAHEGAVRLVDALRRRLNVFLQDQDQGLGVCEDAARIMGEVLGWDAWRVDLEVEDYRRAVEGSRRYRQPEPRLARPLEAPST
ncbi:MAG: glycerol-3-phosphate dehydrogenase [Planctomycetota bacterium]